MGSLQWNHRPFQTKVAHQRHRRRQCALWCVALSSWVMAGMAAHGASVCKGNDQISRFKHAAHQNSQSALVNARLLVPQFPVRMLDRLISGIIHRLWIRHTPQRRCVLGIPTLSLHLLSQEESCCLQKVSFSFVPWSVYRQQRWNKEPRCPTGQTGTKPKCGPDAYLILPWLRSALEMKSNYCLFNNTPSLTRYSEGRHGKARFMTKRRRPGGFLLRKWLLLLWNPFEIRLKPFHLSSSPRTF